MRRKEIWRNAVLRMSKTTVRGMEGAAPLQTSLSACLPPSLSKLIFIPPLPTFSPSAAGVSLPLLSPLPTSSSPPLSPLYSPSYPSTPPCTPPSTPLPLPSPCLPVSSPPTPAAFSLATCPSRQTARSG